MKFKIFLLALVVSSLTSCMQKDDHSKNDEPEHAVIQITAYTNDFEVFAEAHSFVVGETSNVLSHFSNLPSFTALENGSVTIRLIVNGIESNQTLDKPTRKGIYSFDIMANTEGKGQLIYDIKTEKGSYQIIVPDITVYPTDQEAIIAAEEVTLSKTNTSVFTKEQSWKIDFATAFPKNEHMGQIIKTTAQIQSAQGDKILLSAKSNGIVIIQEDNLLAGKNIYANQALFLISGSGLADNNSQVRYMEAKNNFEKAKSDYERAKELAKDKIVSEKELLIAKNNYYNAKVIYDNIKQNFNSSGEIITSPMNGFVAHTYVQNGQYVETGQPIVSISKNETLLLNAEVQQKYAPILGSINSANIRTLQDNKTYTLDQLNGKILSFGRNTNHDNYLIPVSIQIDNKDDFIPGGFVEIYLKTLSNSLALTLPNSAILEEQGNYYVFVQITPELFEKREVVPGANDGLKTEIIKGITQSERIVSTGAIFIKLAQATGSLDAHSGHVH